jgi:hypothetical protein
MDRSDTATDGWTVPPDLPAATDDHSSRVATQLFGLSLGLVEK